ncbi:MAG: amidohydrolase family protein, partial [Proteobacteria bacterium]|nr:amidohydrolase family protein [Pseudomonadota bacterium]
RTLAGIMAGFQQTSRIHTGWVGRRPRRLARVAAAGTRQTDVGRPGVALRRGQLLGRALDLADALEIGYRAAGQQDAVALDLAIEFAAARRDPMRGQAPAAEALGPVRRELAMRRAGHRILGDAELGREIARHEVDRLARRGGDDALVGQRRDPADIGRETADHPRLDLWFGPPGPQWVSDSFLQRIAERAEAADVGVQTHVTESIYEKLHGPRFYGQDTLAHLRDLGVLSPRFSIAHGVWLTEREIEILAETGAAVSHNPSSNLRLRAGIAPVNALLEAGVTVALGMDGTSLNDDEDMFTEMRLALRLHRTPMLGGPAPSVARIFEIATAGGAKLLRKEATLGRLAPGFAADLVLVDLERITWPWTAPEIDPRELVVLRARAGDVDTVLIAGEVVLEGGQPTRFDPAEAGKELAERLAATAYPRERAALVARLLPHLEAYYQAWEMPQLTPYSLYNSRR